MLEILQFIFSSFWVWLGTVILIVVIAGLIGETIGGIIRFSIRRHKKKDE